MNAAVVHVVHCVDTEGPLYEPLAATFDRLRHIFGLDLTPSRAVLTQLQQGTLDLNGLEDAVQRVVAPRLLNYNDTWDKLDSAIRRARSREFRLAAADSCGDPWIYNWFCVDHVAYDENPRRRAMGYHAIYDYYRELLDADTDESGDALHFHYHPQAFVKQAHLSATQWLASPGTLYQVLSRRIIDRMWFPAVNRPGFHVTRPDSHWFLEQFVPFDYASQSVELEPSDTLQVDLAGGRYGDWRRAPRSWEPYHPSHDDYQVPGHCRRWIARCLNIGTRFNLLTEREVRQAFEQAREGRPVVLAFTDHDFRDLRPDVCEVHQLLVRVSRDFPDVRFVNGEAATAIRLALDLPQQPRCELTLTLEPLADLSYRLRVRSSEPTFGPQPFLALKTVTQQYLHDNFDFQVPRREWTYVFDAATLPLRAIDAIGVATNNDSGVTTVAVMNPASGTVTVRYHHEFVEPATRAV